MSVWNPVWQIKINGVDYTNAILANLTITSGRTNIYEQAQAGYINLSLINLDQSAPTWTNLDQPKLTWTKPGSTPTNLDQPGPT